MSKKQRGSDQPITPKDILEAQLNMNYELRQRLFEAGHTTRDAQLTYLMHSPKDFIVKF
jgi:hypothetical protein